MGSRSSFAAVMTVLSRQGGTVTSYSSSCRGLQGLGFDFRGQMARRGDALAAASLHRGREGDIPAAARAPSRREMPAVDPVVDDIRLDAQPMGNLGHAQLAFATGGSIEIRPDVW